MPVFEVATADGRRVHAERFGSGEPVVVFEAGMGLSRNSWGAVVPLVATETTTVVYDRSGLGRSEPDRADRDLARLADDLGAVLDHLGTGPFVLVGHSWGGPIIRSAAAARPERIAGLVLVDQTDERCDLFFTERQARRERLGARLLPLMARAGVVRLVVRRQARHLPEPWASGLRNEDGTCAAVDEQLAELRHADRDLRRLREHPLELPDVPVTVISGTKVGWLERSGRSAIVAAHRSTAEALPQGRHVTADRSSHYVPLTEPSVIADEILRIVAAFDA